MRRWLVAHLVRDEGVAGSNPATPTNTSADRSASFHIRARSAKAAPGQLLGQKRRSGLPPPPETTTPVWPTASLRIEIEPTDGGRKWIARLGKRVICRCASPFITSARVLLAEGHPADAVIELWRPNTDEFALRGRLGAVAATLIDGETPKRAAKNGAPIRFPGMAATTDPAGDAP